MSLRKSEPARNGGGLFNSETTSRFGKKSKMKEIEKKLDKATGDNNREEKGKLLKEMQIVRKEVFTDERKLEQRKAGFERAGNRKKVKEVQLSEFI